jgi:hypothetical protein
VTVSNAAPTGGLLAAYGFEEALGAAVTDSPGLTCQSVLCQLSGHRVARRETFALSTGAMP